MYDSVYTVLILTTKVLLTFETLIYQYLPVCTGDYSAGVRAVYHTHFVVHYAQKSACQHVWHSNTDKLIERGAGFLLNTETMGTS